MKPNLVLQLRAIRAISRALLFAVCSILYVSSTAYGQTVIKQLYLSDPLQVLDRVDPVATADATLAQTIGLTPTSQYLYALRGASRTDFWRYDIAANSWSTMASTPAVVSSGGAMATDGTDIYALRGASNQFWKYSTSLNTWTAMSTTPASVGAGGSLVYTNGAMYAFRGGQQ